MHSAPARPLRAENAIATPILGRARYSTLSENACGNVWVGEWCWGIADLVGNILVSAADKDEPDSDGSRTDTGAFGG